MSLPIIQESAEDGDSPETDSELLVSPSTIHHKTRRETAFSLEGALLFSHGHYVTRIGVINNKGWLLTLSGTQQTRDQEDVGVDVNDNHEGASDENDNLYEEIKERKSRNKGPRYSYIHSNSGSSLQSNNQAYMRHEGRYSFSYNSYQEDPARTGTGYQHRSSHPIHSLTGSDIEKAVAASPLDRSRVVCYCFAICLAITFLIAIVMIISNIITNMYLRF